MDGFIIANVTKEALAAWLDQREGLEGYTILDTLGGWRPRGPVLRRVLPRPMVQEPGCMVLVTPGACGLSGIIALGEDAATEFGETCVLVLYEVVKETALVYARR